MREIKYRAYINRDKYIVDVDTIDFINKEIILKDSSYAWAKRDSQG